jgi:hypothetical protein
MAAGCGTPAGPLPLGPDGPGLPPPPHARPAKAFQFDSASIAGRFSGLGRRERIDSESVTGQLKPEATWPGQRRTRSRAARASGPGPGKGNNT